MIIASCPLRISLVGGSTDHPQYLEKYGMGSVVSFPSDLNVYVTIHRDVFGANSLDKKYVINYSKRELVDNIDDIQNELVRECLKYFDVAQINCTLTSDVYSEGSGLASSSAYLIALIKAIHVMRDIQISDNEVCRLANIIESKINPLVGQQDFYGSLPGFKLIHFFKDKSPLYRYLDFKFIYRNFDVYLLYTGVTRSSTAVLKTLDIDKIDLMSEDALYLERAIADKDDAKFSAIIRNSWRLKKKTSPEICSNEIIKNLDNSLNLLNFVKAHKLCGAGNGGYFLIFTDTGFRSELRGALPEFKIHQIGITETGFKAIKFI